MLKITMLQTPGIELDGAALSLPFKRADALLYYMMIRRSATRQELIALLWESCDEATGLKNLRNTLYTLKKALGGELLISPQRSLVAVNPEWELDCDYLRFTRDGDFSAYQGPLLRGFAVRHAFAFDEWLCRTREKLHEQYLRVLAEKAREARTAGDADGAVRWAREYLREDPYDETMASFLMDRLREGSRYAQAAQVYRQLKEDLSREMGVDPLESTTLLYYEILNQWNDTAQAPEMRAAQPVPVGREDSYAALRAAAASFLEGAARRCSQLLIGELGAGKSELIGHFLRSTDLSSLTTVCCECLQSEEQLPLSVWDRILLPLNEYVQREKIALPQAAALKLGENFSFFRSAADGAPAAEGFRSRRCDRALEDAVLMLFSVAGRKRRVLLILEDLQWADADSLRLLNALLRRVEGGTLMAVLSSRIRMSEDSRRILSELVADGLLYRHALHPLSCAETAEFLRRQIDVEAAQRLTERFYHETGGNLNLLISLVQAYRRNADVSASLESMNEILMNRLRGLSPDALQVTRRVCLFEDGVSSRVLLEMMGGGDLRLNAALEELRRRDIIEEYRADRDGKYRFVHQRIREMAYDQLSAYQRRQLHRQAADCLIEMELKRDERACWEISRHFRLAGERFSALEYRIRALDLDSAQRCEPFSPRYCAADFAGQPERMEEEAHECLRELAALRPEEAASGRLARLDQLLALIRGRLALFRGDTDRGYEILGTLSGSAEAHNARLMASACYLLAASALYRQATNQAERYVDTGMRLLERGGAPIGQAQFQRLKGDCFCLRGDYERARYYFQEAAETLEAQGASEAVWMQLAAVYCGFGRAHRYRNEYTEACGYFKRALKLIRGAACPGVTWICAHYGRTTFMLGDHARARELFADAYAAAEASGELWGKAAAAAYCAYYRAIDGDYEMAARFLEEAQDCARRLNSPLEEGILCFVSMQIRRHLDLEQRRDTPLERLLAQSADDYARRGVRALSGMADVFEAQELNRNLRDGITSQLRYKSSELYSRNKHFMSE